MSKNRTILLLLQLISFHLAFGQRHDFNWLLGTYPLKGDLLRFHDYELDVSIVDKTFPFFITNSTMSTFSGEYVFSFNSWGIHDKENGAMKNSDSLLLGNIPILYDNLGGPFTQGSIALPSQKDTNLFLLFYWDQSQYIYTPDSPYVAPYHLYMAKIDQRNNNGLGSVVEKNILLISDTLANAGITATKHANGRDWWIVVPEIVSNRYHTLLISNDSMVHSFSQSIGVRWPPTVDVVSPSIFNDKGQRYYRFSDLVGIQIFDFDRCTGNFSNAQLIPYEFNEGYFSGFALSRNGRFAYISDPNNLYQYDVTANNIEGSRTLIGSYDGFMNPAPWPCNFRNPQLAPDGRIYLSSLGGCKNIHVINHPEKNGLNSNFRQHSIDLNTFHKGGLPNNPNYRLGPIDGSPCDTLGIDNIPLAAFRYDRDSNNYLRIEFTELANYEPETWYWTFGDGDTSWQRYPVHVYDTAGVYQACMTVTNQNGSDTYCKIVQLGISSTSSAAKSDENQIYYAFDAQRLILKNNGIDQLVLFDVSGKIIQQYSQPRDWIDLSTHKNGFYFWLAIDKKGEQKSGRFMKM